MKKIVSILISIIVLYSCAADNGNEEIKVRYENIEIIDVKIPDVFIVNKNAEIILKHNKKSSCHKFDGFYYLKEGFTRTVAIQNYVIDSPDCTQIQNMEETAILKFQPIETGTYTFKFWKGKDANGNHIWETIIRDAVIN